MNFKKQFDKNINSLNAEINASFLVFGGNFRLYFVTCYITTDRVKRKVIYLQTQKFK